MWTHMHTSHDPKVVLCCSNGLLISLPSLFKTSPWFLYFIRQDHDFFQHLEMHMRSEFPPLCGRDHLSFRSYYFPVKVGIVFTHLSYFYNIVSTAEHVWKYIFEDNKNKFRHFLQNVIDGDLCEQFNSMDPHKQKSVAEELDRTPPEVSKKLEDIRTRYAF